MRLRQEVFIVEQNCPYLDADGKDELAFHLLGCNEQGELMAYCRLLPPYLAYPTRGDVSIGRVVTAAKVRGSGAGRVLMQTAIQQLPILFGNNLVCRISAQSYLLQFYENLGFYSTGKAYLEDDIPHTEMVMDM